ncbi:MAG: fumarylacetoacetase [Gemmatimonadaceae bacterium]|nr:fumarylacetoacetase [Gemmatimonadaceae bacterium]
MPPAQLDRTHAADARSWVESANDAASDFPIQNLPFGVFRPRGGDARIGVAIGDRVLDLRAVVGSCAIEFFMKPESEALGAACGADALNSLMALGSESAHALRVAIFDALSTDAPQAVQSALSDSLHPIGEVELLVPSRVGDYTDFYASIHHATNVGSMFRPDNPLLPNYKYVPIGYHGRASSIVPSGSPVRRPHGQTRDDASAPPSFGPSKRMDYELEVGIFVGKGNPLGDPIPIGEAWEHIFGLALVNDWSARDLQAWEYQPLGPFLAKNFATTVGGWVVTRDALAPFRAPAFARGDDDPAPLPYLSDSADQSAGGFAVTLEVWLSSDRMRAEGAKPVRLSRASFTGMYWTPAQLIAHHASSGCNLRPGDLLASGTVSGPAKDERGCMLELAWRGTEPVALPTGETRRFLEDGDEVVLRGYCERPGARRIGFGECRGIVTSAPPGSGRRP